MIYFQINPFDFLSWKKAYRYSSQFSRGKKFCRVLRGEYRNFSKKKLSENTWTEKKIGMSGIENNFFN